MNLRDAIDQLIPILEDIRRGGDIDDSLEEWWEFTLALSSTMATRPNWDNYFLVIARAVALRADCNRRRVGAVVVDRDHRIVATGYNGAPAGEPGCLTAGACPRGRSNVPPGSSYDTGEGACIAIHAEQNALLYAGQKGCVRSVLYLTDEPCGGCWRFVRASGVERVVWISEGIAVSKWF